MSEDKKDDRENTSVEACVVVAKSRFEEALAAISIVRMSSFKGDYDYAISVLEKVKIEVEASIKILKEGEKSVKRKNTGKGRDRGRSVSVQDFPQKDGREDAGKDI